jgi:seryl-tRNA synthetase
MTEKRFILIEGFKKGTHTGIWDKWKQNNQRVGDELWLGEVVAMLNEGVAIVEENEQLKDALNQRTDQCDKYYKENEQLKSELKSLRKKYNDFSDVVDKRLKELFE